MGDETGDGADSDAVPATTTRRLSAHELARTIDVLTGVQPTALTRLPPETTGFGFDRVVDGQTISRAHLEAYMAIADEIAGVLLTEQRLDDLTLACPDEILPPAVPSAAMAISGSALAGAPEWAFSTSADDPTTLRSLYAPDPTVSYAHAFAADGTYTLSLSFETTGTVDRVEVWFDGVLAGERTNVSGTSSIEVAVDVTGPEAKPVEFRFQTDPDDNNLAVDYYGLDIEGPADPGAGVHEAAREACAMGIIEDFTPLAFRRPLRDEERQALRSLFDEGSDETEFVVGLRMLLRGIFANPSFLYLVELGEAVDGREGVFHLEPWELAARLSYGLCEEPPDPALRAAAEDGSLADSAVLESHARRLLALPCGRAATHRFYTQWLHLDRLPNLNKSPDVFPEWSDDVRDGLVAEASAFVDELVWTENATLETFLSTDGAWLDPRSAFLSGVDGITEQQRVSLSGERAGALTLPAVLAVTGSFDGTSPVERGVFVLEQLLCERLPPPPADEDIAPPPPDPDLTTRERWAAHSDDPACAGCHQVIDPIGFSLEDFDGMGRHRSEENGMPVDARGGASLIGIEDGAIEGGAELARAIAQSERAAACFGEQWLRFALGRTAVDEDRATLQSLSEAASSESMVEVFVTLTTSDTFRVRYQEEGSP